MLRTMSFVEPATSKELVLPVTPAKYFWRHPARIEVVRLDQLGEATLYGGYAMGDCTLENVLLPAQLYPFCVPGARAAPYAYLETLERWCDAGARLQWMVSGTPVNASVLLAEITQGERDGTNDVYITITMRQWRKLEAPVLAVSGGSAATARDSQTGASATKTYTVQAGDCLWSLAEQFYGDGSLCRRLAAANPEITNPNLIYPGQVLTIPPADRLPAANADSPSVQAADRTRTSYDPETARWRVQLAKEQAAMR